MSWYWPAAFAFAAFCASVAAANIFMAPVPVRRDAQVVCTEMRGEWTRSSGFLPHFTCKFPAAK